jgi:hypothetical protein
MSGNLYIVPRTQNPVVIPFHRCLASVSINSKEISEWQKFSLYPPQKIVRSTKNPLYPIEYEIDSITAEASSSEIIISGPAKVGFKSEINLDSPLEAIDKVEATLHLGVVGLDSHCVTSKILWLHSFNKDWQAAGSNVSILISQWQYHHRLNK